MTITDGLMTPAPSVEIAAALAAVNQKKTAASVPPGPFIRGSSTSNLVAPVAAKDVPKAAGSDVGGIVSVTHTYVSILNLFICFLLKGWRGRVARKLVGGANSVGEGNAAIDGGPGGKAGSNTQSQAENQIHRYEVNTLPHFCNAFYF